MIFRFDVAKGRIRIYFYAAKNAHFSFTYDDDEVRAWRDRNLDLPFDTLVKKLG